MRWITLRRQVLNIPILAILIRKLMPEYWRMGLESLGIKASREGAKTASQRPKCKRQQAGFIPFQNNINKGDLVHDRRD